MVNYERLVVVVVKMGPQNSIIRRVFLKEIKRYLRSHISDNLFSFM